MKSSTVKFNIYTLLGTLALIATAYLGNPDLPKWLFTVLTVVSILVSQGITYFSPSGEFVGHGQNWTVGKWITRIGLSLLAMFELTQNSLGGAAIIAAITPIIEIIIRMYGSDTPEQREA